MGVQKREASSRDTLLGVGGFLRDSSGFDIFYSLCGGDQNVLKD
jgi:hypothetical protein